LFVYLFIIIIYCSFISFINIHQTTNNKQQQQQQQHTGRLLTVPSSRKSFADLTKAMNDRFLVKRGVDVGQTHWLVTINPFVGLVTKNNEILKKFDEERFETWPLQVCFRYTCVFDCLCLFLWSCLCCVFVACLVTKNNEI
jgi:hypothetical protein